MDVESNGATPARHADDLESQSSQTPDALASAPAKVPPNNRPETESLQEKIRGSPARVGHRRQLPQNQAAMPAARLLAPRGPNPQSKARTVERLSPDKASPALRPHPPM